MSAGHMLSKASIAADREVAPSLFPGMFGYISAVCDLEFGPISKWQ